MNKVKIYITLADEIEEKLFFQGLNLETFLEEYGVETGKEELQLKGRPATRNLITYIIVNIAGYLLRNLLDKISGKLLKEVIAIIEKNPKLEPLTRLLKWILENEKDDDDDDDDGEYVLELKPLPKDGEDEKVLLEVKKKKK